QVRRAAGPAVAMLYFHPWEFDAGQPRLPLGRLSRYRTYVGGSRTQGRLRSPLRAPTFETAAGGGRGVGPGRGPLLPVRGGGGLAGGRDRLARFGVGG